jgi:nicotinamide-nucleotide amidase
MPDKVEERIGAKLRIRGLTFAVAESCTGGLVGSRITDVPGSSDYFLGGVIAYSNEAKVGLLGVRPETLITFGAVSEPTAREMAAGVCRAFNARIGLAVTGVAGPGGGTPEKPVGMVWLAFSAGDVQQARLLRLQGDRLQNKADSAEQLLRLLEEYLALPV